MGFAEVLIRWAHGGNIRRVLPSRKSGLERFPLSVCAGIIVGPDVKGGQQKMFRLYVRRSLQPPYRSSCCFLREFDGGEASLHGQKLGRDFPNFAERFQGCCCVALDQLQIRQSEPSRFTARIELELGAKFYFSIFRFLCAQIGLAQGCMQAGLARLGGERLLILLHSIVPANALKQEIAEKAVSPRRLAIQMRAPESQASSEIEVLVPDDKRQSVFTGLGQDRGERLGREVVEFVEVGGEVDPLLLRN